MTNAMIDAGSDPRIDDTAAPKGSAGQLVLVTETLERLGAEIEAPQSDGRELIVIDDERLIREGEAAVERFKMSREQILPMARGLAAAKRKYPATRDFSEWLRNSPYSRIDKQDRAALINLGRHEEMTAKFLKNTGLISPQMIWVAVRRELQPQLPTVDPTYYFNKSENDSADADSLASVEPDDAGSIAIPSAIEPEADAEPQDPWASDAQFDLVLLTPSERDLKHLRADYADPQTLRKCLPLDKVIKESAAIIIATQLRHLPVMARALPLWGLKQKHILLTGQPASADITGAEVLITAERGDVGFNAPQGWLDGADPIEIARRLYPDASGRLLVFESTNASGWHCRTWLKSPSIR
jgi:hypothetical protein